MKLKFNKKIFCITMGCLYFILSVGITIPGMGIETLLFIKSVEKQLKVAVPKNKYVLNASGPLYESVMKNIVKKSFLADALSTLNYSDSDEINNLKDKYKNFTDEWFEKYWQPKIDNKENVDFYDISINMIKFDVAIAKKYQSYGYVNTGTLWLLHKNGMKQLFSKDFWKKTQRQQSLADQNAYDNSVKTEELPLLGIEVIESPGVLLLNNKTWFVNKQIDLIKQALSVKRLENVFVGDVDENDVSSHITAENLYHLDLIRGLIITRVGFIMFWTSIIITPNLITFGVILGKKRKKEIEIAAKESE